MRHRFDVAAAELAGADHADRVVIFLHLDAAFEQLRGDGFQMLRDDVLDQHVAACRRRGDHIGAGFDLVGNDRIGAAVQVLHAVNLDHVGAGAADIRAHRVEEVGEIDDMRLFRSVFDDRQAARLDGGKHDVDRRADRDLIHIDRAAGQVVCRGVDHGVFDRDRRAEHFEALDVQIDRADAEVAAAGQRDLRAVEPAKQRADQVIGRAQLAGHLMRHDVGCDVFGVDFDRVFIEIAYLRPHARQNAQHGDHVADIRYIFKAANILRQKRGRDNRDGGVFRAADLDFTRQPVSAVDHKLFQNESPLSLPPAASRRGRSLSESFEALSISGGRCLYASQNTIVLYHVFPPLKSPFHKKV